MKMLKKKIDKKIYSKRLNEISLNFKTLDVLNLSSEIYDNDKFNSIQANIFTEFTKLCTLDLFNNEITSIQENIFQQLSCLQNLWLNNNLINEIDDKAFNGLLNLKWLDLSNNKIESINASYFNDLKSLEILDLENNFIQEIRHVSRLMFQSLKLKNLFIQNNPLINNLDLNYIIKDSAANNFVPDFSQIFNRNLLKNSNAENDYDFWSNCYHEHTDDLNTADEIKRAFKRYIMKSDRIEPERWNIETVQDGVRRYLLKEDETLFKNLGEKFQIIDLLSEGINEIFMEMYKPDIEIGEHFTARYDCGCEYHLSVYLINDNFEVLDKYLYIETFEHGSLTDWKLATHKFNYDSSKKSIRYILFYHSGKDTENMEGYYGSKMTNGFVRILPFTEEICDIDSINFESMII